MPIYNPPIKDIDFLLHEVYKVEQQDVPGYDELTQDFTEAILEESGKIARDVMAPVNLIGDTVGCKLENGEVITPPGFKEAFDQVTQGGWASLDIDPEFGGQGLPNVIGIAVNEMFIAANQSLTMYFGLTHSAMSAIYSHGSDEQKQRYLPKMVTNEWTGTMNLTESHCGTDLGLMRTKAEPQADDSYKISGQKIFISAGDHDMSENIIHLVLAKIVGAPEGIKGVSLFIVPKFMINDDESIGERNSLSVGKIEEKMGIHGNSTCVMDYDGATGYLIGEQHKGMRAMFTMMNEARLGVGMQGVGIASAAYQNAVAYAKDRLQGRDITGVKNPDGPADPIIVHPDVRRSLMDMKSFVEGARAFCMWAAIYIDRHHRQNDADADGLVSILTPIIKGFLTDKGFDTTVQAQQIFGGHGYIEESGMSQFVRDCRIAQIYEGANGIQALDLVGRKMPSDGGKHVMAFITIVKTYIQENQGNERLKTEYLDTLKCASKDLQEGITYMMEKGMQNPHDALAGATDLMFMFGYVCLGLSWAKMAETSMAALEAGTGDAEFYKNKLITGRYFMERQMPATAMHLCKIKAGSEAVMGLNAEAF